MDRVEYISKLGMEMRRETWRNFRWDLISAVFFSLFNAVFGQFYIPMALRHGATNVEVGLLSAAPAIGLVISPIWAGLVAGRGAKPFVLYPNLVARLSLLACAFVAKPWMFVVIALFVNFMVGIQAPAYAALITRMYPPALRGRLMGYVRVALCVAVIPLAYLIGRWIDFAGDRAPLIAASIAGVASIIMFSRVQEVEPGPPKVPAARNRLRAQWSVVQGNRPLVLFFLATSLAGFGNLLANPLYQIYQVHVLNLTNAQIGVTRVAYYACLLIGYLCMGWVIDRLSPRHAMCFGIAVYAAAPLCYSVFGSYWSVLVACGFLGLGDATWDIGCMSYVFHLAPGREAVVFGLHLMLFGIRGTAAPLLSTALSHAVPIQGVFYAASLCAWAGFAVLAINRKQRPGMRRPRLESVPG